MKKYTFFATKKKNYALFSRPRLSNCLVGEGRPLMSDVGGGNGGSGRREAAAATILAASSSSSWSLISS